MYGYPYGGVFPENFAKTERGSNVGFVVQNCPSNMSQYVLFREYTLLFVKNLYKNGSTNKIAIDSNGVLDKYNPS